MKPVGQTWLTSQPIAGTDTICPPNHESREYFIRPKMGGMIYQLVYSQAKHGN
jgi:hypothetical protein